MSQEEGKKDWYTVANVKQLRGRGFQTGPQTQPNCEKQWVKTTRKLDQASTVQSTD